MHKYLPMIAMTIPLVASEYGREWVDQIRREKEIQTNSYSAALDGYNPMSKTRNKEDSGYYKTLPSMKEMQAWRGNPSSLPTLPGSQKCIQDATAWLLERKEEIRREKAATAYVACASQRPPVRLTLHTNSNGVISCSVGSVSSVKTFSEFIARKGRASLYAVAAQSNKQ